jgi:hypothetical protein
MPEIITVSTNLKLQVAIRAFRICEYCRCSEKFSSTPFSVEHIIPRSLGGTNDLSNLAFACMGCNNIKFTKTTGFDIETNSIVPLFHPRNDVWAEHFVWDSSLLLIIGLTPIGRASIESLKLNREELQYIRSVMFLMGEHPPKN